MSWARSREQKMQLRPSTAAAADPRRADPPPYPHLIEAYDRLTRAAYEVMGARWGRFAEAKDAFLAAEPRSREWYAAAERAYRLGLRSTHAYYLWTCGHTALALEAAGGAPEERRFRLRLRRELQSLRLGGGGFPAAAAGKGSVHGRREQDHD